MLDSKEILFALCRARGVSGAESQAVAAAQKLLAPLCCSTRVLPLGSLAGEVLPLKENRPHLLLEAHIDQIGLVVTAIEPDGFLRVAAVGGVDRALLPAQEVVVLGKQTVSGVVCCKPPHLQTAEEQKQAPKMQDVLIDTGLCGGRAKELISPGDRVCFAAAPLQLDGNRVSAPAVDDRSGVAAVLLAVDKLRENPPDCGLSVLLATQEEISGKGALTGGFSAAPDLCLSVDVSFALSLGCPEDKCGKMGEGVMIGVSPALDDGVTHALVRLAKEQCIPYQLEVMGGETSTDADKIAVAGGGVKTGLCSIPERYMHTPVEVVDLADIESTAELLAAAVREAAKEGGLC